MDNRIYKEFYDIADRNIELVNRAEVKLSGKKSTLEDIRLFNQLKVLAAFRDQGLSQSDFFSATGYGYGDVGRDKIEKIYAQIFHAEDCIVRPSIASGTHALSTVLFSILNYGQELLSVADHPYDTLQEVIGIKGNEAGNLLEKGIKYSHLPLKEGKIDLTALNLALESKPGLALIQRSTGYTDRRAFLLDEIGEAISLVKEKSPETVILVDNCYGEFTEKREAIEVGADLMAGSLIKNPGGGIAISGGYIAGRKDLVERCMNHLTAPGLGRETGLSFNTNRLTLQGLFMAPHVTIEALKGAILFSLVYEELGYECIPASNQKRSDIIAAIKFEDPNKLIAFCQAVQKAASVGAQVLPMAWDMPGYSDQVIMASGGFIDGSSIEVSADGPLREPYIAYYQGGMVYEQAKLACLLTLEAVNK